MTNRQTYQPNYDSSAPAALDACAGFIRITESLPPGIDRKLGYCGDARFVLFSGESWDDAVAWDDGRSHGFGLLGWNVFIDTIVPLANIYQIELDGGESMGTHVLLLDRLTHQAFFVERDQAEPFVTEHRQFLAE